MAEPEKGNSLTGKDKGKMSQLDEDISNDFLASWKSTSMTGSDDMDFNFEPVTKGNKKRFNFGKLDMDFSLHGEFGKLSSFKLDMADLDFSSSPKKSTKSKEKSEDESVKGNRPAKEDDFTFTFDFNGLDDFSLDGISTKGGNNSGREQSSKEVGSMNAIECDDLSGQVAEHNAAPEDTMSKRRLPVSEDAHDSKSDDLLNDEGNLDTSRRNCLSKSEIVVDLIQPKGTQVFSEEVLAANAPEMDHQTFLSDKTADKSNAQGTVHDFDSVPDPGSTSVPVSLESANTHVTLETKITENSQGSGTGIQSMGKTCKLSYAELKAKDSPATPSLLKTSSPVTLSQEMDDCSADATLNKTPSEACTVTGTLPAAVMLASNTEKEKPEKSSQQLLSDQASTSYEKSELGSVATGGARLALGIVDCSLPSGPDADTVSCDAHYHAEAPQSTSKYFFTSFGSGSTAAKPTVTAYKVPEGNYPRFSILSETNGGGRTKLSVLARKREDSTQLAAKDRSVNREENGKKLDDNSSSSTKALVNQDPVSEKTEKNADAHNVSRENIQNINGKFRNGIDTDSVWQDGRVMKDDGLLFLGSEKKINDPKTSSFQGPYFVSTGWKTKFSNKYHEKFIDKIPNILSVPKSNISEPCKLSSLKSGKRLGGHASLKIPVNVNTAKHSSIPTVWEKAKPVVNFEKSARFQTVNNLVPSIGAEKQRPLTPSLKRKSSEAAADGGLIKLHPSKRLPSSEDRIANELSTTEVEDEVHTRGAESEGSKKNAAAGHLSPKFGFHQEAKMEELGFILMVEKDANIEKAEACAKELDDMCNMLKKKHVEAKELLVRALVNNNNLLMLNHPIFEEKIHAVQRFAARLMSK